MKKIKTKNYYLLYIDMLGTQERVNHDKDDKYLNVINDLYNETLLILKSAYKKVYKNIGIKCKIFSDNIVLAIEKKDNDDELQTAYKKGIIADFATFFQHAALQKGILTRGVITIGKLYFNNVFIHGEALNRAYQLESKVAIYPRIIYDNEIAMSFILENDRNQKTNRGDDGIFYIDIFKSISALDKYFGTIDNFKNALQNLWCKTVHNVPYKELKSVLGKPKQHKTNYKHLQKIYWLMSLYNKYCEESNQQEYKLLIPIDDKMSILSIENNCCYD